MAVTKYLDKTGLIYLWGKIKAWCNVTFALINHTHNAATTSVDGFLSSTDKTKLNSLSVYPKITDIYTAYMADNGSNYIVNSSFSTSLSTEDKTHLQFYMHKGLNGKVEEGSNSLYAYQKIHFVLDGAKLAGDGLIGSAGVLSVPEYEGATASANATSGLVPPALKAERSYFLKGDGTWGDLSSKAEDSTVVHKTGDEIIEDKKIFQNSYHDADFNASVSNYTTSSIFIRIPDYIKGTSATTHHHGNLVILDKEGTNYNWNGRLGLFEHVIFNDAASSNQTRIVAYKNEVIDGEDTKEYAYLAVGYDVNGEQYAHAPSTSITRTTGTDIITRDYIDLFVNKGQINKAVNKVNVDCDTLIEQGNYRCTGATEDRHYPYSTSYTFMVNVVTNGVFITQIAKLSDNHVTARRISRDGGSTWTPWEYESYNGANAVHIYISANGDDDNNGRSSAYPVKTLDRAQHIAKPMALHNDLYFHFDSGDWGEVVFNGLIFTAKHVVISNFTGSGVTTKTDFDTLTDVPIFDTLELDHGVFTIFNIKVKTLKIFNSYISSTRYFAFSSIYGMHSQISISNPYTITQIDNFTSPVFELRHVYLRHGNVVGTFEDNCTNSCFIQCFNNTGIWVGHNASWNGTFVGKKYDFQTYTTVASYYGKSPSSFPGDQEGTGTFDYGGTFYFKEIPIVSRLSSGSITIGQYLSLLNASYISNNKQFSNISIIRALGSDTLTSEQNNSAIQFGSPNGSTWISAGETYASIVPLLQNDGIISPNSENVIITADANFHLITGIDISNSTYKRHLWTTSSGVNVSKLIGPVEGDVTGNCSGTASNVTGIVAIANGGTGSTTLDGAGIITKFGTQTISGSKTFSSSVIITEQGASIKSSGNDKRIVIVGGMNAQATSGAKLYLNGVNYTDNNSIPGAFCLQAGDANGYLQLRGNPDGTFTWGNQSFLVRNSYERIEGISTEHKDLNNYTDPGFYNVKSKYVDNCPSDIDVDSVLLIYPWRGNNTSTALSSAKYVMQEITEAAASSSNRRWLRKCNNGIWSAWKQIAFTDSNELVQTSGSQTIAGSKTFSAVITGSAGFENLNCATCAYGFRIGYNNNPLLSLCVGQGHTNRGLYDYGLSDWLIYSDGSNCYLKGKADTAEKLTTARAINGIPFDGSADITIEDSTAVHKSGNENVNGIKTLTSSPKIKLVNPYLYFIETDWEKGTPQSSSTSYQGIHFQDKNGVDASTILYHFNQSRASYITITVNKTAASTDTASTAINLGYRADDTISFTPAPNDMLLLGRSDAKWKEMWCTQSSINSTSDERLKNSINEVSENILDAWENVSLVQFKYKDASEEKGIENARIHTGMIAQQIKTVFENNSIDINKYGFFLYDKWEAEEAEYDENGKLITPAKEAGDQYGLRYTEALCIEAAYQRRKNKILENRISELEKQVSDMIILLQNLTNGNG